MRIFKMYKLFLSIMILFSLSACSNNSDSPQSDESSNPSTGVTNPVVTTKTENNTTVVVNTAETVSTVILTTTSTTVTTHSEIVPIKVSIIDGNNNPFSSGNVKIVYPNDVRVGRDIGSFTESTVAVVNGVANFTYTSPSNLDANTSNILFRFYHDSNPSQAVLYTIKIAPAANQIVLTNYKLTTSITIDVDMGLESLKLVSFSLRDDGGDLVKDTDMSFIKITSLNPSLGILKDTNGSVGSVITIHDKNNITVNVSSNTKSGLVPLKVETTFTDVNNQEQNLSEVFNVVVLSGPPTAMSLSYVSTAHVAERAKFVDKWAVTVTDKYNNLVNTSPAVSMGAMAGFTKDSSNTATNVANNLYFLDSGKLNATTNEFKAGANVFANVDQVHDYLVTFGGGYTYDASGKWDIGINADTSILDLVDGYDGNDTLKLGFAVGHNQRADACRTGVEWVANVYPENGNYIISESGTLIVNVEYDYYLALKDVMLWVNLNGLQNSDTTIGRIGESKKINLRGTGFTSQVYEFSKDFNRTVRLYIDVDDTDIFLRNSNFSYIVKVVSDGAKWEVTDDTVSRQFGNDITYCYGNNNQSGLSYVDVTFTAPTPKAGTVSLTNILRNYEF